MKRYRLLVISVAGIAVVLAGVLFFGNINGNLVYYLTPTEAIAQHTQFPDGRRFQLGGFVQPGSVTRTRDGLDFVLSAATAANSPSIPVVFHGAPSQLFQAGIGVIVEGSWQGKDFVSDTMIVKHDETYEPPTPTTAVRAAGADRR